ncbi:hypothetical protein BKN38_09985 [Helicobacter sp. CLO-3]|uniref:hypothetical protein n=1 Tax=unclassified Helicobacter TaxID=2593540 RepID=UPI0008052E2B|nr:MULTISPECIES: hypothetical protein [unclassified Helicobacter]OBV29939.1 hypothetical protein BA723_03355 [Helicobacter sp. CLO-3]OHU80979.1 hypothetical protein BKN38_09985 [Helicobacter sp. CLO-3]
MRMYFCGIFSFGGCGDLASCALSCVRGGAIFGAVFGAFVACVAAILIAGCFYDAESSAPAKAQVAKADSAKASTKNNAKGNAKNSAASAHKSSKANQEKSNANKPSASQTKPSAPVKKPSQVESTKTKSAKAESGKIDSSASSASKSAASQPNATQNASAQQSTNTAQSTSPNATANTQPAAQDSAPNPNQASAQTNNQTTTQTQESPTDQDSTDQIPADISAYKPLPLQIKFDDLISAQSLRDNNQLITLKRADNGDFVTIEVFDAEGNLRATLSFKNNLLEGISKAYKNGQVVREVPYKQGLIDGVMITYSDSGASDPRRVETAYKAGKKHGASKIYQNENLISLREYQNGVLHGIAETHLDPSTSASESGASMTRTHYRNGSKEGKSSGYANGKLVFEQTYQNDFLQGQTKTYGHGEITKIIRHYQWGLLNGEEIVYDYPSQRTLYRSSYALGVLVAPYANYQNNAIAFYSMRPNDKDTKIHKDSAKAGVDSSVAGSRKDSSAIDSSALDSSVAGSSAEIWRYESGQIALEIAQDSADSTTKRVRSYRKDGSLISDFSISASRASGSTYTKDSRLESKITSERDSKTTTLYNADGSIRSISQEMPAKNITQTYKNSRLANEIVWLEGQEITIQKGFFPSGALQFEHTYIDGVMIQGVLYGANGAKIYEFGYSSQDVIFDEAFPQTAALRRAKVLPRR